MVITPYYAEASTKKKKKNYIAAKGIQQCLCYVMHE